ncbi:MAG: pyruvate, phosphate dikinase, partial [Deltaproteobacteria bacterium]
MNIKSKALEVNLASYHVDVSIDERYMVLQEVMASYRGLSEKMEAFLKELSHPYRNWGFIVSEARTFALDYFHQLRKHEKGCDAAKLYAKIFASAVKAAQRTEVKSDAADNLLLLTRKMAREGGPQLAEAINVAFDEIGNLGNEEFSFFVKSYYQLTDIAATILEKADVSNLDIPAINSLLLRYLNGVYRFWQQEKDCMAWLEKEIGQ